MSSKLTDRLRKSYEAYCKYGGVILFWGAAETAQEMLEIGGFIEVAIHLVWE